MGIFGGSKKDPKQGQVVPDIDEIFRDLDSEPKVEKSTNGVKRVSAPPSLGGPHRTSPRSMSSPPRITRPVAQPLSTAHDPFAEPTRSMSDEEVMDKVAGEIARRLSGQIQPKVEISNQKVQDIADRVAKLMTEVLYVSVSANGKQQNVPITDFVGQMRQQLDRIERKQRGLITFKWWEIVLGSVFFGLSFGGAIVFILAIAMR